ncbi:MAG TPA: DinB family protein [Vicinamibacterales bacterium]|nr:DinB family protein [Vicinamibacterales bacterium]
MTHDQLRTLLDYHYWARDRILDAAGRLTPEQYTRNLGSSFPSVRATLCHVYLADLVWYARLEGLPAPTSVSTEPFDDVPALRQAWRDLETTYRALLDRLTPDALTRTMSYTLLNGTPGTSIVWQIFQHVVNHGSYHRGQVTTMLRQLGAQPPTSLDLISFYRERQSASA